MLIVLLKVFFILEYYEYKFHTKRLVSTVVIMRLQLQLDDEYGQI